LLAEFYGAAAARQSRIGLRHSSSMPAPDVAAFGGGAVTI
jgi:hypothetical protein